MFSCEFANFLRTLFYRTPPMTASKSNSVLRKYYTTIFFITINNYLLNIFFNPFLRNLSSSCFPVFKSFFFFRFSISYIFNTVFLIMKESLLPNSKLESRQGGSNSSFWKKTPLFQLISIRELPTPQRRAHTKQKNMSNPI